MAEVHRETATQMMSGSWKIAGSMWKVHVIDVEITLRTLQNLNVCPTIWINGWLEKSENKNLKENLQGLSSKNREASYEEISKDVRQVMFEVEIPQDPTVASI
ncbi:MAG: hypothetical protein EZS28_020865 [Streblomastix strix]|uniref:Uncharacterized protein n=1 Tax=Streblomastix strix TaxID=222440 RepID=A0A5J4VLY1_9EUKA|nr:MAG: hypothetical protein EZS28_020865 [Streblomastix strix]